MRLFFLLLFLLPIYCFACPFCDPQVFESQGVYKDEHIQIILNLNPRQPLHVLIIPNRHVERFEDLTTDEMQASFEAVKRLQKTFQHIFGYNDYVLAVQTGVNGGQTVFHTHIHMLPRREKSLTEKILFWKDLLFSSLLVPSGGQSPHKAALMQALQDQSE